MRQAYLQSSENLPLDIFLKNLPPELKSDLSEGLKLLKLSYGICESGDLLHKIFDDHHRFDLEVSSFYTDAAFYFELRNYFLTAVSGFYVVNMLRAGTQEIFFICVSKHICCSICRAMILFRVRFFGFCISKNSTRLVMDQ